jgi:hypothetical protein
MINDNQCIVVKPVSKPIAIIFLIVYFATLVGLPFRGFEFSSLQQLFFTECAVAVLLSPILIVAYKSAVELRLYEDRLEQTGILGLTKIIKLSSIKQMKCHSGRGAHRSIILIGNNKIEITTSRTGFWEAAEFLRQKIQLYDWQLKYTLLTSEKFLWDKQ